MSLVTRGHWIHGKEIPSKDKTIFPVRDPGNGEGLGEAARGRKADVDRAVDAAEQAFKSGAWPAMSPLERGRRLTAWGRLVNERREDLARLLSRENGKPLSGARDEIDTVSRYLEYFGGWADKVEGRLPAQRRDALNYILREPLGIVGHIIPWNYPADIFVRGAAPCLAMGNTVVVKPDEQAPLTCVEVARLSKEAGLPDGVVNLVTGLGPEAGADLASHPGIQALAFCGSIPTGIEVLRLAAPNLTPVISLELGGKSANILFDDADVEGLAGGAAWGICWNTGQSCGAQSRLFVPKKRAEAAAKRIQETMMAVKVGYGLEDPNMGSLISEGHLQRVLGFLESGKKEGARLAFGGERLTQGPLARGAFIGPTLFTEVKPEMRISREEIFGPVLSLLTFEDEEEALALANASDYGLSASLWTRDITRAHRMAARLDVSHVAINGGGGFGIDSPFGGVKKSGFGREGGLECLLQYSRAKSVWVKL